MTTQTLDAPTTLAAQGTIGSGLAVAMIDGQYFKVTTIQAAIEVLKAAPGTGVKSALKDAGNPLGNLSLGALTEGSTFDAVPPDGLKPAKGKTRRYVISHLQKIIDAKVIVPASQLQQMVIDAPVSGVYKVTGYDGGISYNADSISAKKFTPAAEPAAADDADDAAQSTGPGTEPKQSAFFPLDEDPISSSPSNAYCVYGQENCYCSAPADVVAAQKKKSGWKRPEPKTPPTYTKKGLFEYNDATGYAKMPFQNAEQYVSNGQHAAMFGYIRNTTNGVMLGTASAHEWSYDSASTYCMAFLNGDLLTCWNIEQQEDGTVHSQHPGNPANTDTVRVIWEPRFYGELPAGVLPPGKWSTDELHRAEVVDAYILDANMCRPEALSQSSRRRWVFAHIGGDKYTVDQYSKAAADAIYGISPKLTHAKGPLYKPGTLDTYLTNGSEPRQWPHFIIDDYIAAHPDCTPLSSYPVWRWKAVQEHYDDKRRIDALKDLTLTFTTAPDQPKLSGYHTKQVLLDQHGRRWLFKPAAEGRRFRADVEHHAHRLARRWGYRTADSMLIEYEGTFGQVQRLFDVTHDLAGWTGKDLTNLSVQQLAQLTREHVLDWAVDNDDTHGENVVATTHGDLIGIDKGRCWRYFGSWQGITGDNRANTNCQLIYTALYDAIADGLFEQSLIDGLYRDAVAQAHRMTGLPDEELRAIITAAQEHRPHYDPPAYQKAHPDAPTNLDELLDAAVARKNNLPADITALWTGVYQRAGWTLPDLDAPAAPGVNVQGHRLYSGFADPGLHAAIQATASHGTATFFAGAHVEDAHVLLWRERHTSKGLQLRGQFKLRAGPQFEAVRAYCKSRASDPNVCTGPVGEAISEEYVAMHARIVEVATKVNRAGQSEVAGWQGMLDEIGQIRDTLRARMTQMRMQYSPDTDRKFAAEQIIASKYVKYCLAIQEAAIYYWMTFNESDMPAVYWIKPVEPLDEDPAVVSVAKCQRVGSGDGYNQKIDDDGELVVGDTVVADNMHSRGQAGTMYVITLKTGETIEFRADDAEGVFLAAHGTVEFTAPAGDIPGALQHIHQQLAVMGCTLTPANSQDLEVFYWQHLVGILADRAGSGKKQLPAFWNAVTAATATTTPTALLEALRAAFGNLTSKEQIAGFLASGGHLPKFMHTNLRRPTTASGKPYWDRFDVTEPAWSSKAFPVINYRTGPRRAAQTGACLSTAARTRVLGIWKSGMSSSADLSYGSGSFVFTRQNQVDPKTFQGSGIIFSPRILTRTHNYAFLGDNYGRTQSRRQLAHWAFDVSTAYDSSANELMVKDALSILDDVEMMVFDEPADRDAVIAYYRDLGITEIRGYPLTWRMRIAKDVAATQVLLEDMRQQYTGT